MLKKNIEKKKRVKRANQWKGLPPKIMPSKKEKLNKKRKKHKLIIEW